MTDRTIEVSELYLAPQGEGSYIGNQSLFLRLRRCNLTCGWCDTKQTWDPQHPDFQKFETYRPTWLANQMMKVATADGAKAPPHGLVITGGEPLIWQRMLPEVIDRWVDLGGPEHVEVETNGIVLPTTEMLERCHFNVSPKLRSAGNDHVSAGKLWNQQVVLAYLGAASATFKIVVARGDELMAQLWVSGIERLVRKELHGTVWADVACRIYLMPCATTREELVEAQPWVNDLAAELGVNVTTRMHVLAYGNERRR